MISVPDGTILWRYMDLRKFKSLVKHSALFFCRSDRFSDRYEGSLPKKEAEGRFKEFAKIDREFFGREPDESQIMETVNDLTIAHKRERKFTVVNCWHINNDESDGMWSLYSQRSNGVAIQTTVERLQAVVAEAEVPIYMTKVRYLDYDSGIWYHPEEFPFRGYNFLTPLYHKRIEFRHEQEFRLFHQIPTQEQTDDYWREKSAFRWQERGGINVPVDLKALINQIYVPPRATLHTVKKVLDILRSNHLEIEVTQSKLASAPYF